MFKEWLSKEHFQINIGLCFKRISSNNVPSKYRCLQTANRRACYKNSILKMSSTSHAKEKFRIERNLPLSRHWNLFIKLICKPLAAYIGKNTLPGKKSLKVWFSGYPLFNLLMVQWSVWAQVSTLKVTCTGKPLLIYLNVCMMNTLYKSNKLSMLSNDNMKVIMFQFLNKRMFEIFSSLIRNPLNIY